MTITRRFSAVALAAALAAAGTVAVSPAAGAQTSPECKATATVTDGTYDITKRIVGDNTVAPGGEVTTEITVRAGVTAETVTEIVDYHPAALTPTSARTNAWYLVGGRKWADVNFSAPSPTATSIKAGGIGWTVVNGYVTAQITYKVAEDAIPGTLLDSPSGFKINYGVTADTVRNDLGVCVKVREPNIVENVTGSLDNAGLGSATGSADGGSTGSQISSDPAGFVAEIINGIDIGQLIGIS